MEKEVQELINMFPLRITLFWLMPAGNGSISMSISMHILCLYSQFFVHTSEEQLFLFSPGKLAEIRETSPQGQRKLRPVFWSSGESICASLCFRGHLVIRAE
jgi:hypothetical protein